MEYPYCIELIVDARESKMTSLAGYHSRESYAVANAKMLLPLLALNVTDVIVCDDRNHYKPDRGAVAHWKRNSETNLWERLTDK